jgi:isoquinoline 1-oxidoreductase beta subunit
MTYMPKLSRRDFIVTSGAATSAFALGFSIPAKDAAAAGEGSEVNAWILIGTDDIITLRVHRSEMGQGSFTALPQMIAEELEADWDKVKPEFASANRQVRENKVYVSMGTGGSQAIRSSQGYVRKAGATAREMLIAAAAQRWGVPASECYAEKSFVYHRPSGRKINYGALAADAAKMTPPADVKFKPDSAWKIAGQSMPRFDIPAKTDGSAQFGLDVRLPNMVYAAAAQAPVFGGNVKSYDESKIKGMKGFIGVVKVPNGLAVIAEHYWQARKALEALPIEWDDGGNGGVSSDTIRGRLKAGLDEAGAKVRHEGDFDKALAGAAKKIEAEYYAPFLDHACLEPMNCTVRITGDKVEVWAPTQNAEGALAAAAEAIGVPLQNVDVNLTFMGGGFGRRGRQDYTSQAAHIAKQINRPVKVIWSREEDMRHGHYRPVSLGKLQAGLDASGMPVAYAHKVVGQSIFAAFAPQAIQGGVDRAAVEGTHDQPYKIPNVKFDYVMKNTHVPVSFWRSVGHSMNAWITESFIDEIAHAGGKDPLELRRTLLAEHPSWIKCLNMVAEKSEWGKKLPDGWGRGIAIHEGFGSICAQVAEVSLDSRGQPIVHRVVAAIDCGHAINPGNIAAQVEGNIVYGLTSLLYGEITIKNGGVEQANFDEYQMLRLRQMPKVETYLSLTQGDWWGGVGEPGLPPVLPAVCNAIFQITGKRVRSLPLKNQDLRRA